MILVCSFCGVRNRIPALPTQRVRCGSCKHVFTPAELTQAEPEPPPDFTLEQQEDEDDWEDEDDC